MKKILFVTGTRADFGKLKSLIKVVRDSEEYEYQIFATGMHMLNRYGYTLNEIYKSGFDRVHPYINQVAGDDMEIVLANTVTGLSRFLHEQPADLIVVHGDRVEALAGAIVGALRNTLVAHVEGGEVSGAVDDLMRHAVTKLSHVHMVTTEVARTRLMQLGENGEAIFLIGSPDIDAMLSGELPTMGEVRGRYGLNFKDYAIALLHPVTTEDRHVQERHARIFVESLLKSGKNYVVIYPNNDAGSEVILSEYRKLEGLENIKIFPSIRFEYFLVLLRNSSFIIGNSSAGIHEAPVYGVPTLNLGTRQSNRFTHESIRNERFEEARILDGISAIEAGTRFPPSAHYGSGNSALKFLDALRYVWGLSTQKQFVDIG